MMIKISYEQIIDKIVKEGNLPKEEIENRVNQKLNTLAGLISKEGAAHIVANELGIKLFEQTSGKLKINGILPGMKNIDLEAKVRQVYELREFTRKSDGVKGQVASFLAGDDTGVTRFVLWGKAADNIKNIKEGDVVKVSGGSVKENNGYKEVHVPDNATFEINPEGVTVEAALAPQRQTKKISDLQEYEDNVDIMGTIVQLFDPTFFEICPECGKRVRAKEEGFFCEAHGKQTPAYSYVFNLVLDDGTGTIRVGFFKKSAEALLEKGESEILEFKDNPSKYEPIKTDLLGKIIKVTGRTKPGMFNQLDFNANRVDVNPDPEKEMKKLESTTDSKAESQNAETQKASEEKKADDEKPRASADDEVISFEDLESIE